MSKVKLRHIATFSVTLNCRIHIVELLALMHFLQPDKYALLEQDFDLTDEDREAKIRELHGQLKDIMLRRLKKDVVKSLPTKSERILRVEMSQMQVYWYKNILSRVR